MRFYSGISFRFRKKHLKWLLIPLIALLAFFGLNLSELKDKFPFHLLTFSSPLKVLAYSNESTSWNLTMQDYDSALRNTSCGANGSMYDVVNSIIDSTSTDYYTLVVGAPYIVDNEAQFITFYIKWKSSIQYNAMQYYAYKPNTDFETHFRFKYSSNTDRIPYYLLKNTTCSNYQNNSDFQMYKLLTDTGNYSQAPSTSLGDFNYNNYESPNWTSDNYIIGPTISNDSSYNVDNWYYYSTNQFIYMSYNSNNNNFYNKKICITDNDTCYTFGALLPSYYDLHHNDSTDDNTNDNNYFIGFKNRLNVLYSNFLPNDLNNFNINLKFNTNINNINAYNYYQNIDFTNINCYGRVNHNDNYYTYEKFSSCTFELNTDDLDISSDNDLVEFNIQNLEIYDSNDNKITNFSNYDKLFYYISFQYEDNSLDLSVRNLEFNSSSNILYSDIFRGEIYDNFDNLPIYSKLFFSNTGFSNEVSSNISARTKKDLFNNSVFLYAQKYNLSTLVPQEVYSFVASDSFQNLKVNNFNNIGYMIYNKTDNLNSPMAILRLDLVLMRDIVVSYNNIASNDFYYSDSTGNITNNNIEIDYSNGLTTDLNDLGGLLPPGPLDSLLNIPFYYTNKVITSLNQKCEPWTFNFVFDKPFTMPCFDTFYEEFPPSVVVFLEVIPCAFLLISYFKHLYKKVDRATSLNTTSDDEWGVL